MVVLRDMAAVRDARVQQTNERFARRRSPSTDSPAPDPASEPDSEVSTANLQEPLPAEIGQTIGEVLAIADDDDEPFQVALRVLEIRRLASQIRASVQALPEEEDPEFLLRNFRKVEVFVERLAERALNNAARLHVSDSAADLVGLMLPDPESLYGLEACSRALRRWKKEPSVDQSQLEELILQARSLIDIVLRSEALTSDAKAFLIRRLREVETALLGSRITGYADLEAASDRLTGALARRPDIREPGILAKIGAFFQALVLAGQGTTAIAGATASTIDAINSISSSANQ